MLRKVTMVILHEIKVTSYDLLVWYTSKVMETNLGSIEIMDIDNE